MLPLGVMKKLNEDMVAWICREMDRRELSVWRIAKHSKVTKQWVYELYSRFKASGNYPLPLKCGRKPKPLSEEVKERIKREYAEHPYGAVKMQEHLKKTGVGVSHNKIHAVLLKNGLAKHDVKKQKKRKWVRYERKKFNSLWHSDWTELDCKQLILYEDDATRLITGYGLFNSATAELSLQVFALAVEKWGRPRQLLTDNGAQFCNTHDNKDKTHAFHGAVLKAGCDHIFTRKSHPQCNGKLEKLNHTISLLYKHYGNDLDKAVKMYNEKRIHMSLGNPWMTPLEAYELKKQKGLIYEPLTKTQRST